MKVGDLRRGDRVRYASGLVATVTRVNEWAVILRDDEGHEWTATPHYLIRIEE